MIIFAIFPEVMPKVWLATQQKQFQKLFIGIIWLIDLNIILFK